MSSFSVNKDTKILRIAMFFFGVVFLGTDIVFLVFPHELFDYTNLVGSYLGFTEDYPFPNGKFWLILTNAMMLMITFISFKVTINPRDNISLIPVILIAKLTSSATALTYFFIEDRYFAYLLIFVVDFPIFLAISYFYNKAKQAVRIFS